MLKPVEQYAAGDYLLDLRPGQGDPAARDRMAGKVAGLIGLDPKLVGQFGQRIDSALCARNCTATRGW